MRSVYLVVSMMIALLVAAVALAFAGWNAGDIAGLLGAVSAIIGPLMYQLNATHNIVNSQRTAMQNLLQIKDDELQDQGKRIPHDPSIEPRHQR